MRLWIDTDVGVNPDDSIALLVAAAHPAIDLAGVSTVGRDPGRQADTARALVGPGVAVTAGPPPDFAGADTLLAIGPLTNVAARRNRLPPALVIMGGLLRPVQHRGALRRVEHNLASDPAAAAAVLGHPGATLVPLDVTVTTQLSPGQLAALLAAAPGLRPEVDVWTADHGAVHLHDPAALLVAAGDPAAAARCEPVRLSVEVDGGLSAGGPMGSVHSVVVALDGPAVAARVLELLGGSEPG